MLLLDICRQKHNYVGSKDFIKCNKSCELSVSSPCHFTFLPHCLLRYCCSLLNKQTIVYCVIAALYWTSKLLSIVLLLLFIEQANYCLSCYCCSILNKQTIVYCVTAALYWTSKLLSIVLLLLFIEQANYCLLCYCCCLLNKQTWSHFFYFWAVMVILSFS